MVIPVWDWYNSKLLTGDKWWQEWEHEAIAMAAHLCVWGGQWGLFSKRDGSACSFRPRVGVHGWGLGGFCLWSFHLGIETSSLWLCYGLKDWKIKHDITWNRISWYYAAWVRRSKSHSLAFRCSTCGIRSVLFAEANPNCWFYWISMSGQQVLGKMVNL